MKPCRKEGHGFFFLKSKKIYKIYLVSFLRVLSSSSLVLFFPFLIFLFHKGSGYLTSAATFGDPSPFFKKHFHSYYYLYTIK